MQSPGAVAFTLFGFSVRWYGLIIAAGALLAVFVASGRVKRHGLTFDGLLDYVLVALPLGVVGARFYYVIFNFESYQGDFLEMLNIREGGLAIHGGLIFAFLAVLIMSRVRKDSFLELLDLAVPCIALAQGIGRWGNFFNEEAHGGVTDFPINVLIDGVTYHATFLYESVWCILLFVVLSLVDRNRKFPGQVTCLYGMLYSLERFWVELLRTDSLMIGPFKQAMVLSACVFAVSIVMYAVLRRRGTNSDFTA